MILMRKVILICILIFVSFGLKAQTKEIRISWESAAEISQSKVSKQSSLSLKDAAIESLKLQINASEVNYRTSWKDAGFADAKSLRVTNVNYAPVSAEELREANKELIPKELTYTIRSTMGRDVLHTIFDISPIVNINGRYQKVVSFKIDYDYAPQSRRTSNIPGVSNSVLATGKWYKFKVEKTGIHKLDKSFLKSLGMNTDGINPRNIKVYGHGGKSLPLLNADNFFFDNPELAIQVIGEEDGKFDNADMVLFYATSTEGFNPTNDSNLNPYSDDSYYYVTADGDAGLRVQNLVEPTATVSHIISQFDDYKFYEKDEESPSKIGRAWYGNRFDIKKDQNFKFEFPNIISGQPMNVVIKTAGASERQTSMAISVNGTALDPLTYPRVNAGALLQLRNFIGAVPASGETVSVDMTYNNSGNPSNLAYLDYISIEAPRKLIGVNGQLAFRYNEAANLSGVGEYQITNAAQFSQIWDVTDPQRITSIKNETNASALSFKQEMGEIREFVALNMSDIYVPVKIAKSVVSNQNLKGSIFKDESGNFKDVDYIIITAPFLIQPALRLARYHKDLQGLNVKVVTTDKIYEEFSSGKQDISAIRNFIRYVYWNASNPSKRVKYVGILGDTSIDYKNRLPNNNNTVPTFHTLKGVSESSSFMSDDFFGNMDEDEGTIGLESQDFDLLDIAMGRMISDNVQDANLMVDKIINYTSKSSYGNWRTNFVLISDDVDVPSEWRLQKSLDELGDSISLQKPFINVKKIHADSYKQETSAGGNRYPDVNIAIKDAIEAGAIIMNYFGHGGEDGLAHEAIFTKQEAQNLRNKNNLPCIVTVTCEFTKFDNPLRITAGELTYLNKEGGAISLVTTTRAINISTGVLYNQLLADELFGFGKDVPNTPAEGLRISKNNMTQKARRVVFYIGDPAMQLAFPRKDIRITKVNGVPISQVTDTLKALSKVKIEGEVTNANGNRMQSYNGVLGAKLFDKRVERQTLDNDNNNVIMNFTTLGEVLFNGQATVANGGFAFEFVVPRDTQIPVGQGRLSLYAEKNNALEDQAGVNLDLQVGGLDENAPEDNEGPIIKLYMNDESFVNGGITNNSPILIAKLEDPSGINTASGIGHDIVAVLDGNESKPFILNDSYQADVDDYTKGMANHKFRDLEEGLHTLKLKAWDTYNNSATAEIQFLVAGSDKLEISRVLNYPNPFVSYTEFWFNHNRPFEPLEAQVQVFTVTGKVVWTKNQTINTDGFLSRDIIWDGRDDFGDRIGKGVYIYKITLKSALTNQRVEKFEKLVIL